MELQDIADVYGPLMNEKLIIPFATKEGATMVMPWIAGYLGLAPPEYGDIEPEGALPGAYIRAYPEQLSGLNESSAEKARLAVEIVAYAMEHDLVEHGLSMESSVALTISVITQVDELLSRVWRGPASD